jgi:hypothetical protein
MYREGETEGGGTEESSGRDTGGELRGCHRRRKGQEGGTQEETRREEKQRRALGGAHTGAHTGESIKLTKSPGVHTEQ